MDHLPYSHIQKGTFLIATPEIDSGIFFRSVVLICEHNQYGTFGLIINKNLEIELPEEALKLQSLTNPHISIRAGGPVQANQMMLIHNATLHSPHILKIAEGIYLGGDLQFLQEAISQENGPYIHLCFGYSGWEGGQLEREFLDGNWLLYPADPHFLFHIPADHLWQELLRKMGGKYATLSMMPEDLSLN